MKPQPATQRLGHMASLRRDRSGRGHGSANLNGWGWCSGNDARGAEARPTGSKPLTGSAAYRPRRRGQVLGPSAVLALPIQTTVTLNYPPAVGTDVAAELLPHNALTLSHVRTKINAQTYPDGGSWKSGMSLNFPQSRHFLYNPPPSA